MHLDDRKLKNTRFCNATFTFVQGVTTNGVSSPRTASNNRNVKQKTTTKKRNVKVKLKTQ